jgi:hypothetical protein
MRAYPESALPSHSARPINNIRKPQMKQLMELLAIPLSPKVRGKRLVIAISLSCKNRSK